MRAKLGRLLGQLSLVVCAAVLIVSWAGLSEHFQLGLDGSLIILMLAACSYALIVASGLVKQQHPSADKIFPSCIVAYGLVLVIFHYWFQRLA